MSSPDSLSDYVKQLEAVEDLLKNTPDDQKGDLLDLKSKLTEVILLLTGNETSNSGQCSSTSKSQEQSNDGMDDEFLRFQAEISELGGTSSSSAVDEETEAAETAAHHELCKVLSSMEGNKCRAPFVREWGEKAYHNAIIFSTDLSENDYDDLSNVKVQVMFCNPVCDEMKPCPFFLDGHCKFDAEKCRFSHGYRVNYSELEEYVLPDFSNVQRDTRCLAKYKDGLWYMAIIENCLADNKYFVKYTNCGSTNTLQAHDILPLGNLSLSDDSSDSSEDEDKISEQEFEIAAQKPQEINYVTEVGDSPIGQWESHTKGIGSKLMAKMGYVWGQGLGKNSDGRIEPVEAVVLPKGKSLDKCAEIREFTGAVTVEDKFNAEQVKEQQRIKKCERSQDQGSTVFDFLNKNISATCDSDGVSRKRPLSEAPTTVKDKNSNLNFNVYAVGEKIKKMKKEVFQLQTFLKRNGDRNQVACEQVRRKMAAKNAELNTLEAKERNISSQINREKNRRKIVEF